MISQREILRQYKRIIINSELLTKVVCFKCRCGKVIKTIQTENGNIQSSLKCIVCGAMSVKTLTDPVPDQEATHEWSRPTPKAVLDLSGKKDKLLDYILNGGLLLYEIEKPKQKTI